MTSETLPPILPEAKVFGEPKVNVPHGQEPQDPDILTLQGQIRDLQKQLNTARLLWIAQGIVLILILLNGGVQQ